MMDMAIKKERRRKSVSGGKKAGTIFAYIILILIAAIILYPLLMMVNVSLKTDREQAANIISIVRTPQFINYVNVWERLDVITKAFTTVWITGASVIVNVIVCILAAFPLSRKLFKGSGKVYTFVLASMFFPGSLVATIILIKDVMHVYGTPLALIIMWGLGGLQFNIFMLYNFISSLPKDLDEAAFIDGCGYFRYILTLAMPLMIPIVMTLVMLKIIGCWNDFLSPYIYVANPEYYTLSTGLYMFMGQYASQWHLYSTAVFIVATPMIVLYVFCQRFLISGILSGAIKG